MEAQYRVMERQLEEVQFVMSDLEQRDDNLYRVVFQADPIPLAVRRGSSANTEYYAQLLDMTNSEIVVSTSKKMNELKKELYIQSKSYDELILLAKNKEKSTNKQCPLLRNCAFQKENIENTVSFNEILSSIK